MIEKIKGCSFCGEYPSTEIGIHSYASLDMIAEIGCRKCFYTINIRDTLDVKELRVEMEKKLKNKLIEAWNKRV